MYKVFAAVNKAQHTMRVIAPDEITAANYAFVSGHAKRLENISVQEQIFPLTDGLKEILEREVVGWLVKEVPGYTFNEVISGIKRKSKWVLVEDIESNRIK